MLEDFGILCLENSFYLIKSDSFQFYSLIGERDCFADILGNFDNLICLRLKKKIQSLDQGKHCTKIPLVSAISIIADK